MSAGNQRLGERSQHGPLPHAFLSAMLLPHSHSPPLVDHDTGGDQWRPVSESVQIGGSTPLIPSRDRAAHHGTHGTDKNTSACRSPLLPRHCTREGSHWPPGEGRGDVAAVAPCDSCRRPAAPAVSVESGPHRDLRILPAQPSGQSAYHHYQNIALASGLHRIIGPPSKRCQQLFVVAD